MDLAFPLKMGTCPLKMCICVLNTGWPRNPQLVFGLPLLSACSLLFSARRDLRLVCSPRNTRLRSLIPDLLNIKHSLAADQRYGRFKEPCTQQTIMLQESENATTGCYTLYGSTPPSSACPQVTTVPSAKRAAKAREDAWISRTLCSCPCT